METSAAFQPEVRGLVVSYRVTVLAGFPGRRASDVGHLSLFRTNDFGLEPRLDGVLIL
ncbi:MAG: hypothetical protein HC903_01670 [Methylacidiphilales bacterium]|nr:hypothetical protein [Candidatus Methylacidiphilales bacterium]